MANNILLKKSSIAAKVPTTSDLDYGELALNYADGALYYKTSANAIARLNPPESIGFANVAVSGQSTVTADTATGTLTLAAGNGAVTLTTNSATDTVTISHTDTSSVANLSSDNSAGVVLQDIAFTFDTYGHVQTATVATTDLDSRYLQTESDTLATVTTRGATTTNAITVGGLTVNGGASITGDVSGVDSLIFDTTATEANAVGKLYWNANDGTLSFGLVGGVSINHIGQHLTNYVYNADTTTIAKGEVVYLFGAQGDRASVKKASNASEATSSKTVGVASENIAPGAVGFVVSHGVVDGLSLGAYTPGDTVYLGSTPGSITTTLPVAPAHTVFVGVVARANPGNGQLFVKIQNGLQIDELHDIQIIGLANNDSLFYDASTFVWKNTTPTNARTKLGLGTIATQNANSVAITGGAIDGTPIGATTPSTGKFTTIQTTGNVTVGGNLTVTGTTTTVSAQNLTVADNMIFLNNGIETTISNVSGSGTVITYTTLEAHNYSTGMAVTVTGVTPSQYNITNQIITGVGTYSFTVAGSATGSYVSGGTARAQVSTNPDLGWAAGYNDGTYRHTGFFRDATDGYYKVFKNYTPEPDADIYIDTGHASFALADIQAANFRGALVGNADSATILAYNRTINGVTFNGSQNITITANTTNALTIGAGLTGTSFNGSSAVTITVDSTVARVTDTLHVGTTSIALNRASAAQTLTGVSIDGNSATVTNGVYTTDTATVTNTMLAGSIANNKLLNSAITIAGTSTSLGGSITLDTITGLSTTGIIKRTGANTLAIATAGTDYVIPSGSITGSSGSVANVLTIGSYLTGGSYNGSAAITIAADATSANTASKLVARDASGNFSAGTITANLTGTASGNLTSSSTLTAGNLSGTIPSAVLGNSTVYIGTTGILLNRSSASQTLTGVSIDGNAGTVTNGVYTTGSYANPSWISSLAGSKITGDITGNASNITSYTINQSLGTGNSPSFSGLTVNGNLRVTGIFYDSANSAGTNGQVLTSTGTGTAWSSAGAAVTGTGTANYIPKWSTSTALANSVMQESSSKIGISVAAPDAKLHIAGTHADEGANRTEATVLILDTTTSGNGDGKTYFKTGWNNATNNGVSTIGVGYYAGGRQVRDVLTMWGNGNVGIGTTSPAVKLHVVGDAKIGSNSQKISLFDDGNAHIHATTGTLWLNSEDAGDIRINNQNNGNVVLTNGTGSVGIGVNSPTQRLDVGGNIAWGTDHVLAYSTITTTATTANQVITTISSTTYRTAKFVIQAVDATAGKYQSQEIMAIHNGSTVAHTEYTAINVGGAVATYDVDISAGTIRLLCTPLSTNSTVFKVAMYLIKA
jgi:hypothetical protein